MNVLYTEPAIASAYAREIHAIFNIIHTDIISHFKRGQRIDRGIFFSPR